MTDKGFKCPPPKKKSKNNNQKQPRNLLVHILNCALCFQINRLLEK